MGKPAARIGDMHVCPAYSGKTAHVGGPIVVGVPTVIIGGMPAATLGSQCVCNGPPDVVVMGSAGVMIGGKPAARMGDSCAHGGKIVVGFPTVLIGEAGGGGGVSAMPPKVISNSIETLNASNTEGTAAVTQEMEQVLALQTAAESGTPFAAKCKCAPDD